MALFLQTDASGVRVAGVYVSPPRASQRLEGLAIFALFPDAPGHAVHLGCDPQLASPNHNGLKEGLPCLAAGTLKPSTPF